MKKNKVYGKRYDEPFKKDTVEHWISSKKSVTQISDAFGVSETTLYKWRKKYEFDENDASRSRDAEIIKLRKENAELRQERDILKKSVAIFLKPQK